jgi:hypothetical protein
VPAGTRLFRVHRTHPADSFNPTVQPDKLAGGRFDTFDGSYAYTYLGGDPEAAIAETVCRDLPLNGSPRFALWSSVEGRRLTTVETTRDLQALRLHGAALTQVQAPLALTKCESDQYEITRRWAATLLTWFPDVAGFQFRPRHDEDRLAWALFEDRPPRARARASGALRALSDSVPLDQGAGLVLVKRVLRAHNATLAPLP